MNKNQDISITIANGSASFGDYLSATGGSGTTPGTATGGNLANYNGNAPTTKNGADAPGANAFLRGGMGGSPGVNTFYGGSGFWPNLTTPIDFGGANGNDGLISQNGLGGIAYCGGGGGGGGSDYSTKAGSGGLGNYLLGAGSGGNGGNSYNSDAAGGAGGGGAGGFGAGGGGSYSNKGGYGGGGGGGAAGVFIEYIL